MNTGSLNFSTGFVNGCLGTVLRDTGCNVIGVKETLVKAPDYLRGTVKCKTITGTCEILRTAEVHIDCEYFKGKSTVCVLPETAVADIIIGNVKGIGSCPDCEETPSEFCHYGCAMTRAMAAKEDEEGRLHDKSVNTSLFTDPRQFQKDQTEDDSLSSCFQKVGMEINQDKVRFLISDGLLYREREGKTLTRQLVVPLKYRNDIMKLAHDMPLSGHQGFKRTKIRVQDEFYWPKMYTHIRKYVKSCHVCQKKSKKGPATSKAPLQRNPLVGVPFERMAIDLVGPLVKTPRNNMYILTVVDVATRWVEAIPLRNIDTEHVAEALVSIFTRIGFPKEILSDRGAQFTSDLMAEVMKLIGVRQAFSSPYHPQANGLVERMNGTIKHMLRKVSEEKPKDWDRYLPSVLFAYREIPQETTGFSPFELVYGRTPRGPLAILKDIYSDADIEEETKTAYQYVINLEKRIVESCLLAAKNTEEQMEIQAQYADKTARLRSLKAGDWVLILLPITKNKLLMEWKGPFQVLDKMSTTNYRVNMNKSLFDKRSRSQPNEIVVDRKQEGKIFHINILKKYELRDDLVMGNFGQILQSHEDHIFMSSGIAFIQEDEADVEEVETLTLDTPALVQTEDRSHVVINEEMPKECRSAINELLERYEKILTDLPGKSDLGEHVIKLRTEVPIHMRPYPVPLKGEEHIRSEVKSMLEMGVIEHSDSPYSSPIVLVAKPDGKTRFCIDFRRVNAETVPDQEPIPNQEDLFAKLGNATVFSKIDLTKGYWQIPMQEESKKYTAFQTPEGLMHWKYMAFGLMNAPASFARMMRMLLDGLSNVIWFFDDILAHTESWEDHPKVLESVFERIMQHGLTARPSKMSLGFPEIEFLGHVVGRGSQKPEQGKVEKIMKMEAPKTKKQVKALLGLMGYYRKFIPNFAHVSTPLTNLLKKGEPNKVIWSQECEDSLNKIKTIFSSKPILILPNLEKPFVLRTDASNVGIGAVLMQRKDDLLMPCVYASRKLMERETRYSTVERECLAIVFAVKKFAKYLLMSHFQIQTDHKPLQYLHKGKANNSRLMRWALSLQMYNFSIIAIPGEENHQADVLSRLI